MRQKISDWLIVAHNTFPITFKFAARGAISGSIAGFMLSFIYSILFGVPLALIGSFLFYFLDDSTQGFAKIGMPILMTLLAIVLLIIYCVLPAMIIGGVSGALTGFGVRVISQSTRRFPFQIELFSILFWTPITLIIASIILETSGFGLLKSNFVNWLFVIIPSCIFVVTMIFVAKVSETPFIKSAIPTR